VQTCALPIFLLADPHVLVLAALARRRIGVVRHRGRHPGGVCHLVGHRHLGPLPDHPRRARAVFRKADADMTEPRVLEVFSDYVCPWCYLGSARTARLKKEHGIEVKLVHFPLHPDTPAQGKSLEALFAGRGYDIPKMQAQMRARMAAEGLPYGERKMTYNSRLAQELAKWAESQPGGEAIHDALFRAYFVDGKNIGEAQVL